jgi:hypothetical protein
LGIFGCDAVSLLCWIEGHRRTRTRSLCAAASIAMKIRYCR